MKFAGRSPLGVAEDLLGGARFVDQALVHVEDPVETHGQFRLVGDDGHGHALLRQGRITARTSLTMVGSRAEVGSSKRMIFGSIDKQPGDRQRCFWPPESWSGELWAFSARPTMRNNSMPSETASAAGLPSRRTGPMREILQGGQVGEEVKGSKTMPMRRRRAGTWRRGPECPGRRSRCRRRRAGRADSGNAEGLLPVPEGPMMEMTWPSFKSTLYP